MDRLQPRQNLTYAVLAIYLFVQLHAVVTLASRPYKTTYECKGPYLIQIPDLNALPKLMQLIKAKSRMYPWS